MKRRNALRPWLLGVLGTLALATTVGAITYGDNFNVAHDYLVDGVAGTIWDGLYTGAGSFPGGNIGSDGPGRTLIANANITGAGRLTVQSMGTGWENQLDDGFFLFKNITGDFQMSVHVVSPYSNTPYNTAGLLVRAANPDGSPWNGAENSISFTRLDEFDVANYVRNTINGATAQMTLPGVNDPNYWLRIDRLNGTTFNFYQRALATDPWQLVGSTVERPDFASLTLQVGIMQASFSTDATEAQFESFSLVAVPEPAGVGLLVIGLLAGMIARRARKSA